ncbi:glycosyltransferase [Buttiauxella ferragutiae]|uniref:glycosyltransferase n=1 Tax=Buttiauxella ferragutiae TaxID=82989 RepID=UPI0035254167
MDKISVLMAVYKERIDWVKSAINSIKKQESSNKFLIELIIVLDEPSREKEIFDLLYNSDLSQADNLSLTFIVNKRNIGLARTLNKAFNASTGNYIARIDADGISYPHRFLTQYLYLRNNPAINFIGSGMTRIDIYGGVMNDVYASNNSELIKTKAFYSSVAFHPTWFMKRCVFSMVGGYLPYPNAEDFDFLLRLIEKKIIISNIPEPLIYYRVNPSSLSNNNALQQRKCQLFALKEARKRKYNPHHVLCIKMLESYIKSFSLTEKLHSLSQQDYNTAMKFFLEKKYISALFLLTQSMIISPWQAYNIFRQVKFITIRKLKWG